MPNQIIYAHTDETRAFGRLCGSKEAKAKLANTAAKLKERDRKRKERLKEQAKAEKERKKQATAAADEKKKTKKEDQSPSASVTGVLGFVRDTPAEESNAPGPRYLEVEHEAAALEPGPPPPVPNRRPRQVGAYDACSCRRLSLRPSNVNQCTHAVCCPQPASMTEQEALDHPAQGQSAHITKSAFHSVLIQYHL